jgi:hypothetical protein
MLRKCQEWTHALQQIISIADASGLIILFHLDLNGRTVIVSSAGKDR